MHAILSFHVHKMLVEELIHAIDALIERHLKGDLICPDEYSSICNSIIYFEEVVILCKYLQQDRYFLYDTMYQRYDSPSELLNEIEAHLDCKT